MTAQGASREQIVNHGLHLASAQGLHALTLSDLARELHVPRSGLSTLFSTRTNLHLAVLDQAASCFINEVTRPTKSLPAGEARITALFQNWIAWARADRLKGGCPFVHASREADGLDEPVTTRLNDCLRTWRGELRAAIEEAKAPTCDGRFRTDLDNEQFIFELFGLYLSHHFWHWSMHDKQAEWRTLKAFERLLENARA